MWGPSHGSSFSNPLSGHISSFGNPSSELMVVASGLGSTIHFLWRILLQPLSKMMQSPNDPHVDQPHSFSVLICHIRNNGNCNVWFFIYFNEKYQWNTAEKSEYYKCNIPGFVVVAVVVLVAFVVAFPFEQKMKTLHKPKSILIIYCNFYISKR